MMVPQVRIFKQAGAFVMCLSPFRASIAAAITSGTTIDYWGKFGLVRKRQLPSALLDFGGRFSDEASEGSCEMCLVEIT
jgi:hypothetical protein